MSKLATLRPRNTCYAWDMPLMRRGCLAVIMCVGLLTGCIEPNTFECLTTKGSQLCGQGYICLASGLGCATAEQAAACNDLFDGAVCTVPGDVAQGKCNGGACRPIVCGDLELGYGEACDDGNTDDFQISGAPDGCAADCRSTQVCGNRVTDWVLGEICDDGNTQSGDGCAADCRSAEACGNGLQDPNEACDDGNNHGGDGCAANCRSNETCGNGYVDIELGEQCDRGPHNSNAPNALCRTDCQVRRCGDGVVDTSESCDAGAANSDERPNACRSNCEAAYCGDNVVDVGERCDDGNFITGDGCSANCTSDETCGNGIVDAGLGLQEQCDSGLPGLSGDGCGSVCYAEVPQWRRVEPTMIPPRLQHVIGYHSGLSATIVFGGASNYQALADYTDTWSFDGSGWLRVATATSPSARVRAAMAYDSNRQPRAVWRRIRNRRARRHLGV